MLRMQDKKVYGRSAEGHMGHVYSDGMSSRREQKKNQAMGTEAGEPEFVRKTGNQGEIDKF